MDPNMVGRNRFICSDLHFSTTVWKQAIHCKKWQQNFLATKIALLFMAYRCGSLTFVAINRTTGYQFSLIYNQQLLWSLLWTPGDGLKCMWFKFRIGQNGIGKIHCSFIGAFVTRSKTALCWQWLLMTWCLSFYFLFFLFFFFWICIHPIQ